MVFFAINAVFYAMEMRYAITGELIMNVGDEFGPVEFELLFSVVSILFGIFGQAGLHRTIGQTLGIASGSACPLHIICEYKWVTILGVILCFM